MNYHRSKDESAGTWINAEMDATTNRLLSEAALKSGRSKRKELILRVSDHLERFESISHKGEAVARNSIVKNGDQS